MRFRTVGDITCTAPVESDADTVEKILAETATTTITERGATRMDDQTRRRWNNARRKVTSERGMRPGIPHPVFSPRLTPDACTESTMSARKIPDIDNGLLRFLTCGSVDDGKSTLIGRLLFDTKTILADTLNAIEKTSPSAA